MYTITITQLNSKKQEKIIACKQVSTRQEATEFIKSVSALPKPYKIIEKAPACFYEMSSTHGMY